MKCRLEFSCTETQGKCLSPDPVWWNLTEFILFPCWFALENSPVSKRGWNKLEGKRIQTLLSGFLLCRTHFQTPNEDLLTLSQLYRPELHTEMSAPPCYCWAATLAPGSPLHPTHSLSSLFLDFHHSEQSPAKAATLSSVFSPIWCFSSLVGNANILLIQIALNGQLWAVLWSILF